MGKRTKNSKHFNIFLRPSLNKQTIKICLFKSINYRNIKTKTSAASLSNANVTLRLLFLISYLFDSHFRCSKLKQVRRMANNNPYLYHTDKSRG